MIVTESRLQPLAGWPFARECPFIVSNQHLTDVIGWLLEGDPSITCQVKADLLGAPDSEVRQHRARVDVEGWGRALLDLQQPDGQWGGGFYSPKWVSTTYTLRQLRHFGIDPGSERMREAIALLRGSGLTWRHGVAGGGGAAFFDYIGETCITAMNVGLACYFDATSARTTEAVEFLLDQQMADGGWNCEVVHGSRRSSFHTTISTLEALLEYERAGIGSDVEGAAGVARQVAHEYLLDRHLMRSLSTGEIINPSWTRFSFPPRWWYDVLRGLEYLRDAGVEPDPRWDEAIALVERKRTRHGRWKLQNHHAGLEHFQMEKPGMPSRWNTRRATRVLRHVS